MKRANWLKNLSDTQVPPDVIDIVSLGPNFSHTRRVSKDDVLCSIKNIELRLYTLDVEMSIKNDIRKKSYGKLELDPQKTNPDFDRRT